MKRPDQLDQQVAIAVNQVRRNAVMARHRLGLPHVDYPKATANNSLPLAPVEP